MVGTCGFDLRAAGGGILACPSASVVSSVAGMALDRGLLHFQRQQCILQRQVLRVILLYSKYFSVAYLAIKYQTNWCLLLFITESFGARGSSDVVILLHGFPTSSLDWYKVRLLYCSSYITIYAQNSEFVKFQLAASHLAYNKYSSFFYVCFLFYLCL